VIDSSSKAVRRHWQLEQLESFIPTLADKEEVKLIDSSMLISK
jgi:hypothetical protein